MCATTNTDDVADLPFAFSSVFEHNQESWIFAMCMCCCCKSKLATTKINFDSTIAHLYYLSAWYVVSISQETYAEDWAEDMDWRVREFMWVSHWTGSKAPEFTPLMQSLLWDHWQHQHGNQIANGERFWRFCKYLRQLETNERPVRKATGVCRGKQSTPDFRSLWHSA